MQNILGGGVSSWFSGPQFDTVLFWKLIKKVGIIINIKYVEGIAKWQYMSEEDIQNVFNILIIIILVLFECIFYVVVPVTFIEIWASILLPSLLNYL